METAAQKEGLSPLKTAMGWWELSSWEFTGVHLKNLDA